MCIQCHAFIEYRTLGNFRGTKLSRFSRYCTASAKIKSAKILYDPLCSALCTGVLAKNKEAGVSNVSEGRHSLLLIKVTIRYKNPARSFYL